MIPLFGVGRIARNHCPIYLFPFTYFKKYLYWDEKCGLELPRCRKRHGDDKYPIDFFCRIADRYADDHGVSG